MSDVDLSYDLQSLCGPVDDRVVARLEANRGNKFDPSYLRHARRWHGGIPRKQYFDAADGRTYRIGRFLTLVDNDSKLQPPAQPSWLDRRYDVRVDRAVFSMLDRDGLTCGGLFGGEVLVPFAALYFGDNHPDEMDLSGGYVDLLAFRYDGPKRRPKIVVWSAAEASDEYFRWSDAYSESGAFDDVRYDDFTVPVADDFDALLALLRDIPERASA